MSILGWIFFGVGLLLASGLGFQWGRGSVFALIKRVADSDIAEASRAATSELPLFLTLILTLIAGILARIAILGDIGLIIALAGGVSFIIGIIAIIYYFTRFRSSPTGPPRHYLSRYQDPPDTLEPHLKAWYMRSYSTCHMNLEKAEDHYHAILDWSQSNPPPVPTVICRIDVSVRYPHFVTRFYKQADERELDKWYDTFFENWRNKGGEMGMVDFAETSASELFAENPEVIKGKSIGPS